MEETGLIPSVHQSASPATTRKPSATSVMGRFGAVASIASKERGEVPRQGEGVRAHRSQTGSHPASFRALPASAPLQGRQTSGGRAQSTAATVQRQAPRSSVGH